MELQNKQYYTRAASIAVLLVGITAGVFYWLIQDAANPVSSGIPVANNSNPAYKNGSADNLQEAMLRAHELSGISSPSEILAQEPLNQELLPPEISILIPNGSRNPQTQVVKFQDKRSGYQIKYDTIVLVYQNHQYYLNLTQEGWSVIDAINNNSVALAQVQNDNYLVFIEQFAIDAQNSRVVVTVVQK